MKKKIWIPLVIVVLIAVWLGTAWYTGVRIEAQTGDVIEDLNASWAKRPGAYTPQIKQISYERGLFSSYARFAWAIPALPDGQDLAEMDVTISHGPFPLAALRQGDLLPRKYHVHGELVPTAGPLKMAVGAVMNGKPPLVVDAACTYGNHCVGTGNVPPIDMDLSSIAPQAKLNFGGLQTRFDFERHSDTDYKMKVDAQLLPLSISGQDFGSGQITGTTEAQSSTQQFSWKTGAGESKLVMAFALTQPIPLSEQKSMQSEDLRKLVKSVSINVSLSKPMLIDLVTRALSLKQPDAADAIKQQVTQNLDEALTGNPEAAKYLRTQGDLILSDWQYADDKLTINGQNSPEMLEQLKNNYLAQLQQDDEPTGEDDGGAPDGAASAPASAASVAQ